MISRGIVSRKQIIRCAAVTQGFPDNVQGHQDAGQEIPWPREWRTFVTVFVGSGKEPLSVNENKSESNHVNIDKGNAKIRKICLGI